MIQESDGGATASGSRGTAVGSGTKTAGNQSVAVGSNSQATGDQSTAMGNDVLSAGNSAVAVGGDDLDKVATHTYTATINGTKTTATGAQLFTDLTGSTAIANGTYHKTQAGDASIALGPQARAGWDGGAVGEFDIAIGAQAFSKGFSSIAIGTGATAAGDASFALGAAAKAQGNDATAFGSGSQAIGDSSFAMGHLSIAQTTGTIAFGAKAQATATNTIAFGAGAQATAADAMAFGPGAIADGDKAIAIGPGSKGTSANTGTVIDFSTVGGHAGYIAGAIGSNAGVVSFGQAIQYQTDSSGIVHRELVNGAPTGTQVYKQSDGSFNTAQDGSGTKVPAYDVGPVLANVANAAGVQRQLQNVAPGRIDDTSTDAVNGSQLNVTNQQVASNTQAIAANAVHFYSVNSTDSTQGNYNNDGAAGANSLAAGVGASASGENGVAVGSKASAGAHKNNVAIGSNVTADGADTSTGDGIGAVAIGSNQKVTGNGAVAIGIESTAKGDGSVALGRANQATGAGSLALGDSAGATEFRAVALGSASQATGSSAVAVGDSVKASAQSAIAIGRSANATASYATAMGDSASASGASAIAIGQSSNVSGTNAIALGNNITNGIDNSVALGNGSTVADPNTGTTAQEVTLAGTTYNFTGLASNANSVVSVGAAGKERQLQNVAAGDVSATSTDGINGSQLYATNQAVNALGAGAVQYDTKKDSNGDTVPNYDSVTLGNGKGTTGTAVTKNADGTLTTMSGGTVLSNVASAGDITDTANAYHAVNAGDLNNAVQGVANKGLQFGANAGTTNPVTNKLGSRVTVQGQGADWTKFDGGQNLMTQVTQDAAGNTTIGVALAKDLSGLNSVTTGSGTNQTVLGGTNGGVVIGSGATQVALTNGGLNNGGNKITNVADGTAASDAATVGQMQAASAQATTDAPVVYTDANGKKVVKNGSGDWMEANADGSPSATPAAGTIVASMQNSDGTTTTATKLTNVAPGTLSASSTDAVNGSQLHATNDSIVSALGGGAKLNTNGTISGPSYTLPDSSKPGTGATTSYTNVGDALTGLANSGLSFTGNGGSQVNRKLGQTLSVIGATTTDSGTTLALDSGAPTKGAYSAQNVQTYADSANGRIQVQLAQNPDFTSVQLGGTTGPVLGNDGSGNVQVGDASGNAVKITNVAAGTASTDAANVGQIQQAAFNAGQNGPVVYTDADGNKVAKAKDGKWYAAADVNPDGSTTTGATEVTGVVASVQNPNAPAGKAGDATTLTNVAAGSTASGSTDAINGGQLSAGNTSLQGVLGSTTTNGTTTGITYDATTNTFTGNDIGGTGKNNINDAIKAANDQANGVLTFAGDNASSTNNVQRKLGQTLNITGGQTDSTKLAAGANIGVTGNGTDTLSVQLAKDIDLGSTGSVTTGNSKMDNSGLTVSNTTGGTTTSATYGASGLSFTQTTGGTTTAVGPSVGPSGIDAGNTKITNVAAGTAASDAATVGQIQQSAANAQQAAPVVYTDASGNKVTKANDGNWYAVADVNADGSPKAGATQVADSSGAGVIASVQSAGGSTTTASKLANVAAGTLSSTSTDAVNGSQLYATNNSIVSALGGNAKLNADGTIAGPSYSLPDSANPGSNKTYTNVGDALTGLADSGLNFQGDQTGTAGTVNRALGQTLAIKGGADTTKLSDNNIGVVKNTAGDGYDVKLAQNIDLDSDGSVTTGNSKMDNSGLTVDDGSGNKTVVSTAGTTVSNAAGDSTSYGANGVTITPSGGGSSVSLTTGGLNNGGNRITNVAAGTASSDAATVGQIQQSAANAQQAAPVVYTDAAGNKMTKASDGKWYAATNVNADGSLKSGVTSADSVPAASVVASMQSAGGSTTTPTTLGNVANGAVNSTSTQAVNGSQLNATNQTVQNLGSSVATGLGGSSTYDATTGTLTTKLDVGGTTYNSVNDALNGISVNAGAGWNVTTSAAAGTSGVANGSSTANVGPGGTHTIQAGNNIITTQNGTSVEIGVNPDLKGLNSVSIVNGPTLNSAGINMNNTKVTNLAPGTAPTDTVTLGQMPMQYSTPGNPTTPNPAAPSNDVTLVGGNASQPVTLHNVAAGTSGTDAANVGQVMGAAQQAQANAQNYTDQRVNGIYSALSDIGKRADAGVAGAMAAASLPQPYRPGQSMVGAALGGYHGQAGLAVGVSTITDNGSWVFKANVSGNTQGNVGVGVGAGFVW